MAEYFPRASWRTATPQAHGMSATKLKAISANVMGAATINRHGYEVYTYGDPSKLLTGWASCARSVLTTMWGMLIHEGRIFGGLFVEESLEQSVRALDTPTARKFGSAIKLKHVLSYTSQAHPPGSKWSYSSGDHWPMQHAILEELTGETVQRWVKRELLDVLGGGMSCHRVKEDGTNRIYASPRAFARWGYLWLHEGRWRKTQLLDPAFVTRATAGGPDGDGKPWELEGMQIHLSKHEKITGEKQGDTIRCPGVPSDCFFAYGSGDKAVIAVIPSLDLVIARYRSHGYPVETFLGKVCEAVTD